MGGKESKKSKDYSDAERILLVRQEEELSEGDEYSLNVTTLPYSVIPDQRLPFDDPCLKRLIPFCNLRLSILDSFFKDRRCWYLMEIEHGNFRWRIRKRFRDFLQLHHQMQVYRAFLSLHLPKIKFEKRPDRRISTLVLETEKFPKVPSFPLTESISRRKDLMWRMAALENYLQSILKEPYFRDYHEFMEFLEIGPLSFIEDLGPKGKEGFIRRRSNCGDTALGILCTNACGFWKKRWLFLKENFVALIDSSSGDLETVMLLDKAFRTTSGRLRANSDTLVVQNLSKKLIMQCESKRHAREWSEEINFVLDRGSADFMTPNQFESFAPPRLLTECKWIVDGATYFEAVALALDAAKEEIFIADWWLSPEIYLRRPTTHGHYWQLDYVLRRKAREGVRIYILLYKELELALGINSFHTEQRLSKMHPNIQVLRHPYVSKGILLWAHHEKIVCVDQTYAFVGGLDLCYGRWDDYQHRLTDLGESEEKLMVKRHLSLAPKLSVSVKLSKAGSDTDIPSSVEILNEVSTPVEESVSSDDISSRFKPMVRKLQARRIFERIRKQLSAEELGQLNAEKLPKLTGQPCDSHRAVQEMALIHLGLEVKFRLWHGKDYVNFISKDFQDLQQPYSDIINRSVTPRMPWHDVGVYIQGMVARDIARHFILRWNHAKEEVCPYDSSKPYLMPKCYSVFVENVAPILKHTVGTLHRTECQVLRSLCFWSGGICDTESSIHKAYINVIRESKGFIYIENQFFITQPCGSGNVYNGISDALFNRILKAHRERAEFRVYVILPLLPAFEGEVGTGTGTLIQAITHWNYKSICYGHDSLIYRLSRHMKDPSKYIGFYGLRTHGTLANKPVTELIYVHSKLLIADDQVAIIGSANINDRSMLGRRDSEIAVIVRDTKFLDEPSSAGEFCYSLRTALFREHLGLYVQSSEINIQNPISKEFFENVWNDIAIKNTNIYEEVFRCLPTNKVTSFAALKRYQQIEPLVVKDLEAAKEKLKDIQGYLVQFPLEFLAKENLEPRHTAKEHYLPVSVFT